MTLEIWKPIVGYEGLYEVYDLGRIKSFKNNRWGLKGEKFLKPGTNKGGYLRVCLSKNGKIVNKLVSRLVAEAFIPNPNNKSDVDHINKIRDDNRVENLQWLMRSENIKKGYDQGRVHSETQKLTLAKSAKEANQIISTWINEELNLEFTGNAQELVRAFPEQSLCQGHLSRVRNKKANHHKGWINKS